MSKTLLAMLLALACEACAQAAEYFVSPEGKAANAGTKEAPWDVVSALGGQHASVKGGDTIWLLPGEYTPSDSPSFMLPVKLQGASDDKPIIVRGFAEGRATITVDVRMDNACRFVWLWDLELTGKYQAGLHAGGVNTRYINLVIRDSEYGGNFNAKGQMAADMELYGCILYSPVGQNVQCFNDDKHGLAKLTDNMFIGSKTGQCMKFYTPMPVEKAFHIEGNFFVQRNRECLVSCYGGSVVKDNVLYSVGWKYAEYGAWDVSGNTWIRSSFKLGKRDGDTWWNEGDPKPGKPRVIIRPNRYDPRRANLAVIDWSGGKTAEVSLTPFLKEGDSFRLLKPTDFHGRPVSEGTYDGVTATIPVGDAEHKELNVFVLLKTGTSGAAKAGGP